MFVTVVACILPWFLVCVLLLLLLLTRRLVAYKDWVIAAHKNLTEANEDRIRAQENLIDVLKEQVDEL